MNSLAMYRGMVVRENTSDDFIIRQVWDDYGLLDFENKTVIDGGAHIGAFTNMALQKGASKIIAFEPERENVILLNMNVGIRSSNPVEIYDYALVGVGVTHLQDLHVYSGEENRGMHTLIENGMKARGITSYSTQEVIVKPIIEILHTYYPDIIKLDIEGGEVDLFIELLSDKNTATQMAIEFHAFNDNMREINIGFVDTLLKQGWIAVKPPAVDEGHQATVGVFKR